MADCQETLKELERFLDSELPKDRSEQILSHLKICSDCQGAFEFHAELRAAIRTKAQKDELPEGFLDRLKGCFGDEILGQDTNA
ncbi:MAG: anti-sigma factor [Actinomycetota bacterium]|jgi:anti-sigma factor (TIGR02949 family)